MLGQPSYFPECASPAHSTYQPVRHPAPQRGYFIERTYNELLYHPNQTQHFHPRPYRRSRPERVALCPSGIRDAAGRAGPETTDAVLRRLGCEIAPLIVTRADATVATTTVSGWADALATESFGAYLDDIAPYSGAAKIISLSLKAELGSSILQNYPVRSGAVVAAAFVAEGGASQSARMPSLI